LLTPLYFSVVLTLAGRFFGRCLFYQVTQTSRSLKSPQGKKLKSTRSTDFPLSDRQVSIFYGFAIVQKQTIAFRSQDPVGLDWHSNPPKFGCVSLMFSAGASPLCQLVVVPRLKVQAFLPSCEYHMPMI